MKTTKKTAKPKITPKNKQAFPIFGVLFAAIVFIILSMMVIYQSDVVKALRYTMGAAPSSESPSVETMQVREQLQRAQDQLTSKDRLIAQYKAELAVNEELTGHVTFIKDFDLRVLRYILLFKGGVDIIEDSVPKIEIIIHKKSPSGKETAVIYGWNGKASGFFIRDETKVLSSGVLTQNKFDEIRNVKWVDEHTLTYDALKAGQAKQSLTFTF